MAKTPVNFSDFECLKENIKPIDRQSNTKNRLISIKNNFNNDNARLNKIKREQKLWENAIKNDKSNDPLKNWYTYIRWTRVNYVNDNSKLLPLLEKCCFLYKNDERYKNSKKYLRLWMQYANLCSDTLSVLKHIISMGVGLKYALFWKGYMIVAEQNSDYDLVHDIYKQAKIEQPQPFNEVQHAYQCFLNRMGNSDNNNNNNDSNNDSNSFNDNPSMTYDIGTNYNRNKENIQQPTTWNQVTINGNVKQNRRRVMNNSFQIYDESNDTNVIENKPPTVILGYNKNMINNTGNNECTFEENRHNFMAMVCFHILLNLENVFYIEIIYRMNL